MLVDVGIKEFPRRLDAAVRERSGSLREFSKWVTLQE